MTCTKIESFIILLAGFLTITSLFSADVTVYKYRVYCATEAANVYTWRETEPTACPNDPAHTINGNSISIVDERGPATLTIKEELIATGGYFKTETLKVNAAAGPDVTTTVTVSWPYDISLLIINFVTTNDHKGDFVTVQVPFDTTIGTISQDVTANDTVINVSQSVIETIAKGFYVTLDDGGTTDDLGRVTAVDATNKIITVETVATKSFLAATPTYVKISVNAIDNFEIGQPWHYVVGLSKIGGSHISANTTARIKYLNKSASAKSLVFSYEYLY